MVSKVLNKILSVRVLVTLQMTGTFCYLSAIDKISTEAFMAVFGSVIVFYFNREDREQKNV